MDRITGPRAEPRGLTSGLQGVRARVPGTGNDSKIHTSFCHLKIPVISVSWAIIADHVAAQLVIINRALASECLRIPEYCHGLK